MFRLKLKAGAMQLTLCIVVMIALLLMAFLLFTHSHKLFKVQSEFAIQTIKNSNRGINYTLLNDTKLNDTTIIELDDNHVETIQVNREYWGVFERVTSVSKIKNHVVKKTAIIGGFQNEKDRIALYLQDNNQPLVVVGNTMIKGMSYLPQKGIKSGSISGQSYYGNQLIYGAKKNSSNIPKLHAELIYQIDNLSYQYLTAKPEQFINIVSENSYHHSFFEPVKFMFSIDDIRLSRVHLIGNIIIQSKTRITVENSSNLKDVILIAPEIEVQDGVKGNFQVFANKNIVIDSNVVLEYPTAIILNETQDENDKKKSKVILKSNSYLKGSIIFIGQPASNNYESQIELQDKTTVFGEVYCNQNIDLKGTVLGSVYTNNFIAKQSGYIYQNHIYNGTISIDELPQQYIGVRLSNSKKGIIKWLY